MNHCQVVKASEVTGVDVKNHAFDMSCFKGMDSSLVKTSVTFPLKHSKCGE